jgi:hypothetical protein
MKSCEIIVMPVNLCIQITRMSLYHKIDVRQLTTALLLCTNISDSTIKFGFEVSCWLLQEVTNPSIGLTNKVMTLVHVQTRFWGNQDLRNIKYNSSS